MSGPTPHLPIEGSRGRITQKLPPPDRPTKFSKISTVI